MRRPVWILLACLFVCIQASGATGSAKDSHGSAKATVTPVTKSAAPATESPALAKETLGPFSAIAVEPAAVDVPRYDQGHGVAAEVIALATGTVPLPADLQLTLTATPGLTVKVLAREDRGGDVVWPLEIRAAPDAPADSEINFRLAYPLAAIPSSSATAPGLHVERTVLKVHVKPAADASLADDADVSIEADAADPAAGVVVSAGIAGQAYLSVRNKSNDPFRVETMRIDKPEFLNVNVDENAFTVAPHEARRVPVGISLKDRAPVGVWLVGVTATLSRGDGATAQRATVAVEQKVSVGVPGVSDMLKVLDLPSLLLVPGALVLAVWGLLRSAVTAPGAGWLDWKSASFWIVSITLSIVIFFACSRATSLNYLFAYNVEDVARLWIGCVAAAVISFFVWWGLRSALRTHNQRAAERDRQAREPLQTDKPVDILGKLAKASLPFYLPTAVLTKDGMQQDVFKLGFAAPDAGSVWVAPAMLLQQIVDAAEPNGLLKTIDGANNRPADGRADLVRALQTGISHEWIRLEWEVGAISRPEPVQAGQLGPAGPPDSPIKYQ